MEKVLHCMEIQFPQAFMEFCSLLNAFDEVDYEKRKLFLIRGEEIMEQAGQEMGLSIHVQREDIFQAMHRI